VARVVAELTASQADVALVIAELTASQVENRNLSGALAEAQGHLAEVVAELAEAQAETAQVLSEIGPEVLEALVADCETYLDAFLDGAVPQDVYQERAADLATTRGALELRVSAGTTGALRTIQQVRDLAAVASSARVSFQAAHGTSSERCSKRYFVTSTWKRAI